jgi:hypothetical protein
MINISRKKYTVERFRWRCAGDASQGLDTTGTCYYYNSRVSEWRRGHYTQKHNLNICSLGRFFVSPNCNGELK